MIVKVTIAEMKNKVQGVLTIWFSILLVGFSHSAPMHPFISHPHLRCAANQHQFFLADT